MNITADKTTLVSKLYWKLIPALILSCVVISANSLIDSLFAGRCLGPQAMALIGLFGPVNTLLSGLASLFATGSQQLCCHAMGRGDNARLRQLFTAGALFLLAAGVLSSALMVIFRLELASFLGAKGALRSELAAYAVGIAPGVIGQMLSCYLMPCLQINGKSRLSYVAMAVNLVANTVFNALFVVVFSLGLFGMGLATALSGLLCMGVMLPAFFEKDALACFRPRGIAVSHLWEMAKSGSPVLMFYGGLFLKNYGMNLALLSVNSVDAVAVLTLQGSLCGLLGALGFSSGAAVQMLSSFYIGEGDRAAVKKLFGVAVKTGLLLFLPMLLVLLVFSVPILQLFGLEGAATQAMALRMIRLLCVAIPLNILFTVVVKLFQAAGKLILVNAVTFAENALQAAFVLLFVGSLGPDAAWAAFPVGTALCLLAVLAYGFSGGPDCRKSLAGFLRLPADLGSSDEARMTLTVRSMEDVMGASHQAAEFCRENGMTEKACMAAELCIEEMAGNVVTHGFSGRSSQRVWVLMLCKDGALTLRIRDNCTRFDPKEYLRLPASGDISEHIGIRLVASLAKDVEYKNVFGMNMLTIQV